MDAHYITPIILAVQTTPEAPPEAGFFYLYGKADGRLYGMNAAGVEKLAEYPTTTDFVAANDAALTNSRSPTAHVHASADLTSGTLDPARLGSGGAAGKFLRFDNTWQTIAGGGDVLAANNLSDLLSAALARTNLGLGTAATTASTAYATAAQGTTADLAAVASTTTAALALKAPLAAPTFTGLLTAATVTASGAVTGSNLSGTNTGDNATNSQYAGLNAVLNAILGQYKTVLSVAGSHIAARVAGTYAIPYADALAISGTGTLYAVGLIHIVSADWPTVNGLATKLRIRAQINCNDVAPTGNFTVGLYPVTRPATSGGAGLNIYTLGTVVSGSNGATVSAPAADSSNLLVGADFALPSDGLYCIGVVTTATVATSAHVHVNAQLQQRNA